MSGESGSSWCEGAQFSVDISAAGETCIACVGPVVLPNLLLDSCTCWVSPADSVCVGACEIWFHPKQQEDMSMPPTIIVTKRLRATPSSLKSWEGWTCWKYISLHRNFQSSIERVTLQKVEVKVFCETSQI
jgi:hypothetical protein